MDASATQAFQTQNQALRLALRLANGQLTPAEHSQAQTILDAYSTHQALLWRIAPLLLSQLKQQQLYTAALPEITQAVQLGMVRELGKQQQLRQLMSLLAQHEIDVILLKGTAFAQWLYHSDAPRLSNDIDILVQPQHWDKACALLSVHMQKVGKPVEDVFDDAFELSFIPRDGQQGYAVDLHAYLTHAEHFTMDLSAMWDRVSPHPAFTQQANVKMLSVEDALVHQAIHAFKDMQLETYGMLDSAKLLAQSQFDEKQWRVRADEFGADIMLYLLFDAVDNMLDHSQARSLANALAPSRLRRKLCMRVLSINVTKAHIMQKAAPYRIKQVLFQLLFTRKFKTVLWLQLKYLKGRLFSPRKG